jgi:transcriptional regulator with XRE-family HTH domain
MRLFRALRGLSQAEVAHSIGRSQAWLSQIERGYLEPSSSDLDKLALALRVDASFLTKNTKRPAS